MNDPGWRPYLLRSPVHYKVVRDEELKRRFYPESNISGFTHVDGAISFYGQLAAILRPSDIVLDFGAGRGQHILDDAVEYRRSLRTFRGRCRHIDGCDIDSVVLENPFVDNAKVISNDEPYPYEDNRFDIIISRFVFEHIANPKFVASELLRIVKPGGMIAAVTPNKWGYIGTSARMVPNRYHVRVLSRSQPDRKPEDVFPTQYKLNTPRALRRAFGESADIVIAKRAPEPAYHFGRPLLYRLSKMVDKHAPDSLLPIFDVYVIKHETSDAPTPK